MKSIFILRSLFCCMILALAGSTINAYATNDPTRHEQAASYAFMGIFGGVSTDAAVKKLDTKKSYKQRKTVHAVMAAGITLPTRMVSNAMTQRNQAYAGSRVGVASTQSSNMQTPVNMVLPESTMGGTLTFSISTTANVKTTYIPFLPSKSDEALPANVTFAAGAFLDFDDFTDFYVGAPVILSDVLVTTNVQANFGNPIRVTRRNPDGSTGTSGLTWDAIGKDLNNTDQTGRLVVNSGWTLGISSVKYELQMEPNSNLSFSARIAQIADVKAFRPYNG